MPSAAKKRDTILDQAVRREVGKTANLDRPDHTESLALADLNAHLGYFLRRLQVKVFKDFIRTLAPMDVRPAQHSVLVLIDANPGRSQAVIGEALNIERARLARMLHELEERRWIERRAAVGDGRSHS